MEAHSPSPAREFPAGTCVLFVDDARPLLDALVVALRKEPYVVLTASSGTEGLAVLAQRPVDVVVSDEMMPGMSGGEFLGIVRKLYPHTIRIVLTGQASLDSAIRAINEGAVYRFLTKPCSAVDLAQTIRNALEMKELTLASTSLLGTARRQRHLIEQLEVANPGISRVERTGDGCIVVEPDDLPVADLIVEMRQEVGRTTASAVAAATPGSSRYRSS